MTNSNLNQNPIVVAIDIGTTKVCAVASRRNAFGKLEILGVSKVESDGVLRGVVSNIEKTVQSISNAVRIIEQRLNQRVHTVHIGIAGQHIKSLQHHNSKIRENADAEISSRDIQRLIDDMHRLLLPPGDKILHVMAQEYTIDNEQGITDPIGMTGVKLETRFHIVTGQTYAINNLIKCVEKAGLKLADITLEPIASASATLSPEEKEAGIALVDIGGGTTDLIIYYNGIIRHTAVIPLGSNSITKDIKEGCNVMQNQAEKLKVKYGQAFAAEVYNDKIITIPGLKGRDNKEISLKNLALIIQARLEEIFDFVLFEIKKSGYESKLIGGLVITGGGALIENISQLAAYHTGLEARIGLPIENLAHGYNEIISSPEYATVLGLTYLASFHAKSNEVEDKAPLLRNTSNIEFVVTNEGELKSSKNSKNYISQEKNDAGTLKEKKNANEQTEPKSTWKDLITRAKGFFNDLEDTDLK